jgi:hypothetical protein
VTTTIAEDVAMMEGQLRTTEERLANTEEVLRIAQAHNKDLATELERVRHEHAQDMAQMQQEHTIAVQRAAQVSGLIRSMARQALEGIEMMRGNDFVPRPEQVVRVESAPARENLSANCAGQDRRYHLPAGGPAPAARRPRRRPSAEIPPGPAGRGRGGPYRPERIRASALTIKMGPPTSAAPRSSRVELSAASGRTPRLSASLPSLLGPCRRRP